MKATAPRTAEEAMESSAKDGPYAYKLLARAGAHFERGPEWKRQCSVWIAWLLGLARVLDRRHSSPQIRRRPRSTRVLSLAFDAFLVLADPEWWQAHPPRELSEEEERRLGELRELRQRMIDRQPDGWVLLADALHDAVEVFFRAGYKAGLDDCLRVLDLILEPGGAAEQVN